MKKKIIELTKVNDRGKCLLCCVLEATTKVEIKRVRHNDSVISFDVCDICLARMQQDIQKICE